MLPTSYYLGFFLQFEHRGANSTRWIDGLNPDPSSLQIEVDIIMHNDLIPLNALFICWIWIQSCYVRTLQKSAERIRHVKNKQRKWQECVLTPCIQQLMCLVWSTCGSWTLAEDISRTEHVVEHVTAWACSYYIFDAFRNMLGIRLKMFWNFCSVCL